ncbi:MAG: hypothetical protein ABUS48_01910 [Pseudomonadota bacterium]
MTNRVGVLFVHGIGTYKTGYSERFRKKLKRALSKRLGADANNIIMEEVFWAENLKSAQSEYRLNSEQRYPAMRYREIRQFVLDSLADAAAYQKTSRGNTYENILRSVARSMSRLRSQLDSTSPIVVVAHSFGGEIISRYVDELLVSDTLLEDISNPIERFQTVAGIVTLGCNIPVFTFRFHPANVHPFVNENSVRDIESLKWYNIFSPFDVLGYPLKTINRLYDAIVNKDILVLTGGLLFWNPGEAHLGYWKHPRTLKIVRDLVVSILKDDRFAPTRILPPAETLSHDATLILTREAS